MPLKKIYILANPKARGKNEKLISEISEYLNQIIPTELITTTSPQHAIRLAAELGENPNNLIAGCGGDGTINAICQGLPPQGVLGIIPAGTATVVARELGIPLDLRKAGKLLVTGAVRKIDLGITNGTKFIFVDGLGFDAEVASKVCPTLKKYIGRLAYVVAGVKHYFSYKEPLITIIDEHGEKHRGKFVLFTNMRRYGGELYWSPHSRYDDGILEAIVFKTLRLDCILKCLNRARKKIPQTDAHTVRLQGKKFLVETEYPIPHEIDGEVFPASKNFEIAIAPDKLKLVAP